MSLRLIEVLRILLVVAIGIVLAQVTWFFIAGPQASAPDSGLQARGASPGAGTSLARVTGDQIAAANLFGLARTEAPAVTSVDAPETRLRLELQGVFQSDHEDLSGAIVAEQNRPGELYRIDDRLPGNATLAAVYSDRILLRRGGVLETLRFPEVPTLASSSGSPAATDSSGEPVSLRDRLRQRLERARAANQERQQEEAEDAANNDSDDQDDDSSSRDTADRSPRAVQQFIDTYGDRLREDPEGTLSELGISPATGGGYEMGEVSSNPYFAQAGLQPGDVILSVNGQPVGNIQSDQARMQEIMAAGSARIEVQRGSRRFFVTAPLR